MKKITFLIVLMFSFVGFSQTNKQKIQAYLTENRNNLELTTNDISDWIIESEGSSTSTNINSCYVLQRYNGIEIFRAVSNFAVKDGKVLKVGNRFVSNAAQKINTTTPTLSVLQALTTAYNNFNLSASTPFTILETLSTNKFKISNGLSIEEPVTANLVYQQTRNNNLKLAWNFTIYTPSQDHIWSVRVDAVNGSILETNDLVISCNFENAEKHNSLSNYSNKFTKDFFKSNNSIVTSQVLGGSYRVIPFNIESPNHGPRELISNPENVLASPKGWHNSNSLTGTTASLIYTITRGNNSWAQEDANGNNGTGASPNGTASLNFDFPYGGNGVAATTYTNAATTNLFYMNNIMHDVWYQYGFNEANGNFQVNNYGKGGVGNDAVLADAQDRGAVAPTAQAFNNANFSTPGDGGSGRMQMYLWNIGPKPTFTVNSPSSIAGNYTISDNVFTAGHVNLPPTPGLTRDLVLFDDGTPDNADGCTPAINAAAISGKIAVIRRGDCTFVIKTKAAQNAGAAAVIIINNEDTGLVNMSGADATITIPSVFISLEDGDLILAQMAEGTVNVNLTGLDTPFVNVDGDFDNGVIAHEYGHGISNRLTGGAFNGACLQNGEQAGEGWSDWFGLMMQLKAGDVGSTPKGIGTFAISQPTTGSGIRNYQYSTDMAINPITFVNSNDAESHNRGEFMTAVLWDLTWAYIAKYSFNSDVYAGNGGNNKVMRLVIDGLKLQPCGPSILDFRTALIDADQATTGGQDYCMITQVFARRGLGLNASSGDAEAPDDQVEDFTAFPAGPNCLLSLNYFENNDMFKVYPNPSNGLYNIRINQYVGAVNIQVVDINGRVVYNVKDDNFNIEKTIDLSAFQSGMYIMKVSGDAINFSQKIIKN